MKGSVKSVSHSCTPGKIILSGEHSVVYGKPALSMAVNRYTYVDISGTSPLDQLTIQLVNFAEQHILTSEELSTLQIRINHNYQQFIAGNISIRQVIQQPYELIAYTIFAALAHVKYSLANMPHGITLRLHSNIPIGCGMGSSAVCIVGVMTALYDWLNINMEPQHIYQLAHNIENLQHGRSSGIDIRCAQYGNALRFQQGVITPRPIPELPLLLVNTGQPSTSTGECVSHSKTYFHNSDLANRFAAVTEEFDQALLTNNQSQLQYCIQQNHRLLVEIDVVPQPVQKFIAEIEQRGGAAKVCGAGSCAGLQCGIVLATIAEDIQMLCNQFNYQLLPIKGATAGSHILPSSQPVLYDATYNNL